MQNFPEQKPFCKLYSPKIPRRYQDETSAEEQQVAEVPVATPRVVPPGQTAGGVPSRSRPIIGLPVALSEHVSLLVNQAVDHTVVEKAAALQRLGVTVQHLPVEDEPDYLVVR